MKKLIATLLFFGSVSVCSADSYLYWMLDVTGSTSAWIPEGGGEPGLYAKIKQEGGSYLNIYADDGTLISSDNKLSYSTISSFSEFGMGYYAGAVSGENKFLIEIFASAGSDTDPIAQAGLAYSADNIAKAGIGAPATMATVNVSVPVPEPSSGLLMLIGAAVLGLRRKKMQKKA